MMYIAEFTSCGLYTMRVATEIISSTPYMLKGEIVHDCLFVLDSGEDFIYKATSNNKLFDDVEACREFIDMANRDLERG